MARKFRRGRCRLAEELGKAEGNLEIRNAEIGIWPYYAPNPLSLAP